MNYMEYRRLKNNEYPIIKNTVEERFTFLALGIASFILSVIYIPMIGGFNFLLAILCIFNFNKYSKLHKQYVNERKKFDKRNEKGMTQND